ncbi:MAG TPA: glycosyltransferase family 4 protein [Burkholderiales bacterium]|nr:glycosyltransferase family 4 protein [Burkholderiales bacterium]
MSRPRLLYLVTEDWYFCSHRLPLAAAAREAGFDVSVATRVREHADEIRRAGVEPIPIGLSRRSVNPFRELRSLTEIVRTYRAVRPDIVHHVALKPVVYGSLAARLAGVPAVVNALAGLGYLFSSQDRRARLARPAVEAVFRTLLDRSNSRLIVQNPDDLRFLVSEGVVDARRATLIRGSGVDTARFVPAPEPQGVPLVVLPARMLRDKGVFEFVAAAAQLKKDGVAARFALVGDPDPDNPASIPAATLQRWSDGGAVEWWGWRDDMVEVFHQSHVVCLPSYREGLPKALIDAAACGRAIVTCDVPGCREVVREGENGLLVPPRDSAALAAALGRLLGDAKLRQAMGIRGRARAVAEFSVERVIEQTLGLYRELLAERSAAARNR